MTKREYVAYAVIILCILFTVVRIFFAIIGEASWWSVGHYILYISGAYFFVIKPAREKRAINS